MYARSRLKTDVANTFAIEVEEVYGSTTAAACNAKVKLVETELEMVRAIGLFHCGAAVTRLRWINTCGRLQRDEIH